MNIGFSINRRTAAAMLLTALAITALTGIWLSHRVSPAFADEPPVDAGCFNGALSDDPLHCYVLEAAQREGIIKIESIFQGGKVLYVYLHDAEPVSNEVLISNEVTEYFKAKSIEFVEQWPDQVFYSKYETCSRRLDTSPLDCLLNHHTGWHETAVMPHAENHENILLRPWTSESLRSTRGWAAYRQVWPDRATGGQGVPAIPSLFDVSEVDMTNIPELDCYAPIIDDSQVNGCDKYKQHPNVGNIVGWYTTTYGKGYVQLKPPEGEDLDAAAAKAKLVRAYPASTEDRWVITPVKYDYQELWRWATLLDRFAFTSGNSIGITGAFIASNIHPWANFAESVFPLPSLPEAEIGAGEDHRATIGVVTLHLQETLDALPKLLSQLGIPVDAVGVVIRPDGTPEGPRKGWFSGGEPTRVSTGDQDIQPSGSGGTPSPPDASAVETDANQEPGQPHTPAGTAEEAPHTLAGTPPESKAKASDTSPSGPDRDDAMSGPENTSAPKQTPPTAPPLDNPPTQVQPTGKTSQSNAAINTVEDKSHTKKSPAAQTTPTMTPATLPGHGNKRGTAASNGINIDAKPVEARAVVPPTNGPGPSPATDPAPNTEGESFRLWVSIAAALALVALCSVAFIGVRLTRRRN